MEARNLLAETRGVLDGLAPRERRVLMKRFGANPDARHLPLSAGPPSRSLVDRIRMATPMALLLLLLLLVLFSMFR
jgi:hypothetical protein